MIVVKVELHSAITGEISEIGRMEICNDGTGDSTRGNYTGKLFRRGSTKRAMKQAHVKNHARLSYSVWVLVAKMLGALGFKHGDPSAWESLDAMNGRSNQLVEELFHERVPSSGTVRPCTIVTKDPKCS